MKTSFCSPESTLKISLVVCVCQSRTWGGRVRQIQGLSGQPAYLASSMPVRDYLKNKGGWHLNGNRSCPLSSTRVCTCTYTHENTYTVGHIVQRTQETVINDLTDGYVKPAPSSPTHEDSKWLPNTGPTSGPHFKHGETSLLPWERPLCYAS